MNERLLLELVGMLAGGASVSQILSRFSGNGGSASYDGLQAMLSSRYSSFQVGNPLKYRQEDIVRRSEAFIDTLGFNPTTGAAQGAAQLMAQVYKVAPDVVGALIGLPNQQSFYQQLANNSAGISRASGRTTSLFNPYSARDAYNHAVNLAHSVANLAILPNGKGFNIDFTHGLNMDEIGMVTSRLLSSKIPYHRWKENGEMGDRLDEKSQEFQDGLKALGDKFNSTASMLTKLTGSIKESLKLMDELAGGNFLGGTKAQAEDVARRAQNMAATVRLTAAVAGVSPQEAYQNMLATQQGLLLRSGVDPRLASASGYSGMLMQQAANATISYNMWAAGNPNASPIERERAMLAIQARFTQYNGTNGEAAAAIVSGHLHLFSEKELETIKNAYRRGEPDSVRQLIQNRIGIAAYTDYMNDPAAIQGFREAGDQDFLREMAQAATEGNDTQTHRAGARRMLSHSLSRTDYELSLYTGDRRLRYKDRRDAATDALRRLARENGLSAKGAASMDLDELRNYLNRKGVDPRVIERTIHSAEIERQERDILANTMSSKEEATARRNLIRWVDSLGQLTKERKDELKKQIEEGGNLNQIYDNERLALGIKKYDPSILGGKISKAESDRMLFGLAEDKKNWAVDATDEELMRSIKPRIDVASLLGTISLAEGIVAKDFTDARLTDRDALYNYDVRARNFIESGKIKLTDKETTDQLMAETRKKAFTSVISDVIGGKIGKIGKDDKNRDQNGKNAYDRAIERIRDRVIKGVTDEKNPESIQFAFNSALKELKEDEEFLNSIGDDGRKRIEQLLKDENNEVRKGLNRETIAGKETSLYQQRASAVLSDLYKDFFGAKSSKSFIETAEKLVKAGVISENAWKGIDRNALNTDAGRRAARKLLTPDALNSRVNRIAARLGVTRGDPNAAAMAGIVEDAKLQGLGQEDTRKLIERMGKTMGLSEDQIANLTKSLDDTQAAKNANALSEAINFDEGSFSKKEIERGREVVNNLRDAMGNDEGWKQALDNLNDKDENKRNAARNKVRKALESKYADKEKLEHAVNYTAAFAGSKQGEKTGTDLLIDKKSKIESDTLYGAAKSAYSKDSIPYDILTTVSSILDRVTALLNVTQTMQGVVVH